MQPPCTPAPLLPTTRFQGLRATGVSGVQDFRLIMAQTVELSLTTSLREELTGVRRAPLFVRRFRRGRGGEFLETRIVSKRIEYGIEPEQRRSKRRVLTQCSTVWD
jgi:hypothetical protein